MQSLPRIPEETMEPPEQGKLDFVTLQPVTKRPGRRRKYHTNAQRQAAYRQRLKHRKLSVFFLSKSDTWGTPPALFDEWNDKFHFTLDACALPENAKCARYFTPDQNGLQQDWGHEVVWLNPPYGRQIGAWMQKAYESSKAGATVVCLVPSKTGPRWWHQYVLPYAEIHSLEGRIKFVGAPYNAPFDSAIVIFQPPIVH
jgi:phage N-6-adenine-methyltransferase